MVWYNYPMDLLPILTNLNVLYAEDDIFIQQQIVGVLNHFFKDVYIAGNGKEALEIYRQSTVHVIIADIKMPKMDGLAMAKEIRKANPDIPIIITSGFTDKEDLLDAIRLHLVDYLPKPISYSALKEALGVCASRIVKNGGIMMRIDHIRYYDPLKKLLYCQNGEVQLTKKEYLLIELFIRNQNRLMTRHEIEQSVYEGEPVSESAYKNLMFRFRQKVGADNLLNVKDGGYLLRIGQ